jgi:CheY-like chemotaxis protein
MKGERILVADDRANAREALSTVINIFGSKDGHKIVGEACSKEEVEALLNGGLKPSVAFVDGNFPEPGDGQEAAGIIRKLSPETFIISLSSEPQKWGDENWVKNFTGEEFVEALTELQH